MNRREETKKGKTNYKYIGNYIVAYVSNTIHLYIDSIYGG